MNWPFYYCKMTFFISGFSLSALCPGKFLMAVSWASIGTHIYFMSHLSGVTIPHCLNSVLKTIVLYILSVFWLFQVRRQIWSLLLHLGQNQNHIIIKKKKKNTTLYIYPNHWIFNWILKWKTLLKGEWNDIWIIPWFYKALSFGGLSAALERWIIPPGTRHIPTLGTWHLAFRLPTMFSLQKYISTSFRSPLKCHII